MAEKGEIVNWKKNKSDTTMILLRILTLVIFSLIIIFLFYLNRLPLNLVIISILFAGLIYFTYKSIQDTYNNIISIGISSKQLIFKTRKDQKSYFWNDIQKIIKEKGYWAIILKNGNKIYDLENISKDNQKKAFKMYNEIMKDNPTLKISKKLFNYKFIYIKIFFILTVFILINLFLTYLVYLYGNSFTNDMMIWIITPTILGLWFFYYLFYRKKINYEFKLQNTG